MSLDSTSLDSTPAALPEPAPLPEPESRPELHHGRVLRIAIVIGILAAILVAGGGADAAQHAFAHMFPTDVNACGGG